MDICELDYIAFIQNMTGSEAYYTSVSLNLLIYQCNTWIKEILE